MYTYEHAYALKPEGREGSLKAVHLSPYIRGGAQAEQCVLSFTEETEQTVFNLFGKEDYMCVCVWMHVCVN